MDGVAEQVSGELKITAGAQPAGLTAMGAAMLNRLIAGATLRVLHGSISARELAAGAVSQAKLVEEFVGEVVLRPRSVTTANFADGAVTTGKLAANAVQREHLAANTAGDGMAQNVDGSLSPLPDDATLELDAGALQIKADGVGTSQLADYSVAGGLAADAVETENLRTGAVTSEKIVDEAVTQAKLAAGVYGKYQPVLSYNPYDATAYNGYDLPLIVNMADFAGRQILVLVHLRHASNSGTITYALKHGVGTITGNDGGKGFSGPTPVTVQTVLGPETGLGIGTTGWGVLLCGVITLGAISGSSYPVVMVSANAGGVYGVSAMVVEVENRTLI